MVKYEIMKMFPLVFYYYLITYRNCFFFKLDLYTFINIEQINIMQIGKRNINPYPTTLIMI